MKSAPTFTRVQKSVYQMFYSVQLGEVRKDADEETARHQRLRIIKLSIIGGVVLLAVVFGIVFMVVKNSETQMTEVMSVSGDKPPSSSVSHKESSVVEPLVEPQSVITDVEGSILSQVPPFVRQHWPYFVGAGVFLIMAIVGLTLGLVLSAPQEQQVMDGGNEITPGDKELEIPGSVSEDEPASSVPSLQTILISIFSIIGVIILIVTGVVVWRKKGPFCGCDDVEYKNFLTEYEKWKASFDTAITPCYFEPPANFEYNNVVACAADLKSAQRLYCLDGYTRMSILRSYPEWGYSLLYCRKVPNKPNHVFVPEAVDLNRTQDRERYYANLRRLLRLMNKPVLENSVDDTYFGEKDLTGLYRLFTDTISN